MPRVAEDSSDATAAAEPVLEPLPEPAAPASVPAAAPLMHLVAAHQPPAVQAATVRTTVRVEAGDGEDEIDVADAIDPDLFPIFEEEAVELMPQLGGAFSGVGAVAGEALVGEDRPDVPVVFELVGSGSGDTDC